MGTVSKVSLGKLLTDGMERVWAFPSANRKRKLMAHAEFLVVLIAQLVESD